jgi:signal transduction histidine kinase
MKVLIAEDNQFYRRLLETTLAEWGYEPVGVTDGLAAWQMLQEKGAPRLAIIDRRMPGLDGLEICNRVRANSTAEPTYIIMLTAKHGKDNVVAALQGGADDYITKPFVREELQARLQVGVRIIGLQNDLAARVRELEDALSGALKLEAIGRLAGGVAHDFNNLLTVILGYADLLLTRLPGDAPYRDVVGLIKQSAERGAGLTRQLLTFSRKQVFAPVVLDLNACLADIEKLVRRLIGEDVRLETRPAPRLSPIKADPGQIEQILVNLLVNARDAMPGGGRVTVTTENVRPGEAPPKLPPGDYVRLTVADSGCGMDEQTQSCIFEPFFTTKEVGKGTGLGLATVYGIVKQSQGMIQVKSTVGQGTTFIIYFPAVAEVAPAAVATGRTVPGLGNLETVLVVEDEDEVRQLATQVLQIHRYTVLAARSGAEALHLAQQHPDPIRLLMTDVVMPEMTGCQLASHLATLQPDMKIIYMSGYMDETLFQRRVSQPEAHFLGKPFTPAALVEKVRGALGTGRSSNPDTVRVN